MSDTVHLEKANPSLVGTIALNGSKSISNRALIALALADANPAQWLTNLSTSKDTITLEALLAQTDRTTFDAGDAGTTFRFMTAYLAIQPGTQVLTGSARMKERPIGTLVDALTTLGANIRFLEKEGYPPLEIGEWNKESTQTMPEVAIHAGTSSQFLSALLLIAPYLPKGLRLIPQGNMVSRSYLDMTIALMHYFGAIVTQHQDYIEVAPGNYAPRNLTVEADWSAASYWYSMAAISDRVDLRLTGLFEHSWQGDSVLSRMMERLGVATHFEEGGVRLQKNGQPPRLFFEWDFIQCPDIAQTLAVTCAALGVQGLFTGLETLFVKETDRITALKNELKKIGVSFTKLPAQFSKKSPDKTFYMVSQKAEWPPEQPPQFVTYGDHRMAMSFAPLALLQPIIIEDPAVVGKSYPDFWENLKTVGFRIETNTKSITKTHT